MRGPTEKPRTCCLKLEWWVEEHVFREGDAMSDRTAETDWQEAHRERTFQTTGEGGLLIRSIVEQLNARRFCEQDVFAVHLALEEAIVNAIKHGNRNDPGKWVSVRYEVSGNRAVVEVEDQGAGFDWSHVPDPTAPENLERSSGRGVLMMRHFMTWVRFNERGNCVTMCRLRSSGGDE